MRRIDFEVDGLPVDAFVVAGNASRLVLNFALDVSKVVVFSSGYVVKLSPFLLSGDAGRRMRDMDFIAFGQVIAVAWHVDQLKDEGSSCYDATSSRQKVPAYDILKD